MKAIRLNEEGEEVKILQRLLNKWGFVIDVTGKFDATTQVAVKRFQELNNLPMDGIVGDMSWETLQDEQKIEVAKLRVHETDFIRAAKALGVEVAAVKAVKEVETGGRGGFFAIGKPAILFEGHIFWSQLKQVGKNPEEYVKGNENILYSKWTKTHYVGGIREYERLEKAMAIDETAAKKSASYGLFQIMGFNYEVCGCSNVDEFVSIMSENEGRQLDLFVSFLQGNGWDKFLKTLDWTKFARYYNGPGYAKNKYDELLKKAYLKHK